MPTATRKRKQTRAETTGDGAQAGSWLPGWAPPTVFAVLTVLLFRDFIFSSDMLFGTDTFALGYFARAFYGQVVQTLGTFPQWNPLIFGGLPFVDGMHGDIFYPTSVLLFLMDAHRALGWKLVFHVFLAGVFAYVWLRELGLGREAALFGGVVYMLGADLVSLVYPGHDGKLFVTALTPLLFWLAERAVRHRGLGDFAFFALGVALLIYTAHMQLAYFAIWGISAYFLFRLVQVWRRERSGGTVARLFGLFALSGILGAAAASVQLVPPYLYLQEWSHRAEKTVEAEEESGYAYSTSWSLHPEEAAALVVPEFVGGNLQTEDGQVNTYWGRNPFKLNHEYAGFLPLLLLPLLFLRRRRGRDWFFLGLAGVTLLYALGDTTPAFRLFYALVPGVKLFRAPSSIAFLFAFSVATLGAFALERLLSWSRGEAEERDAVRRYLWFAAAGFGLLALLASTDILIGAWRAVVYPDMAANKLAALEANLPNIRRGFWITFLLAGLVATAAELVARGRIGRRAAVIGLALLAVFDLWRVDQQFILTTDPALYFSADESIRYLQNRQARGEVFRVFDVGAYPTNLPAVHGLEQLAGHHGNELGRYRQLIGGEQAANVAASELRLLDLANVRYLVTARPVQIPGYREVHRGRRTLVYENQNALPRAFLVGRSEVVADEGAVDRLLAPDFDFRTTAILPEPLPEAIRIEADPQGSVEWVDRGLNRHTLRVETDRPALLVVTDNYYDAWHARVDGDPVPLLRADYTFRAIPVPAGEHEVEMVYRSGVFRASAFTSVGTLILLLGIGMGGAVRRRRKAGGGD